MHTYCTVTEKSSDFPFFNRKNGYCFLLTMKWIFDNILINIQHNIILQVCNLFYLQLMHTILKFALFAMWNNLRLCPIFYYVSFFISSVMWIFSVNFFWGGENIPQMPQKLFSFYRGDICPYIIMAKIVSLPRLVL